MDGSEVMGIPKGDDIEDFQAFEEEAQAPGDGREFAGDGRREGDAMKFIVAIGEQALDPSTGLRTGLCGTDAACLRVGWVEPEVVREDHFPGFSRRGVGTHVCPKMATNLWSRMDEIAVDEQQVKKRGKLRRFA